MVVGPARRSLIAVEQELVDVAQLLNAVGPVEIERQLAEPKNFLGTATIISFPS